MGAVRLNRVGMDPAGRGPTFRAQYDPNPKSRVSLATSQEMMVLHECPRKVYPQRGVDRNAPRVR